MTRPAISGYPVNLVVAGRRCVVVGAGRIAARKIDALLAAGADVHVVAPEVGAEVRAWAERGRLTARRAPVLARPTSTTPGWPPPPPACPPSTGRCSRPGEARRVWVNSADDPANCSFTLTSVVRQGDLVVTIGTGRPQPRPGHLAAAAPG